jgi:hypothetical protein
MVRVGLWGGFDVDDVGQMLLPRIVRRELRARVPGATVRVWTTGPPRGPIRYDDPSLEPPMPLGVWTSSRADELAVASDVLVISGDLSPDRPFPITGVGPVHEPDVPTAWFGVRLGEEPDAAFAEQLREAVSRRAYVGAADERTAAILQALGDREIDVVPGHALAADRLFRSDEPEERTARMRADGLLPQGDVLVIHGGESLVPEVDAIAAQVRAVCEERGLVPVLFAAAPGDAVFVDGMAARLPDVWRLPDTIALEDACAAVAWSAATIAGSPDLCLVAAAFGRPTVVVASDGGTGASGVPADTIAETLQNGGSIDASRAEQLRARLDAHFDRIAALATQAVTVGSGERSIRSLAARLAEQEAAAAGRQRELEVVITQLSHRLTEGDVRFASMWRKIRECDKHYNWQFNRAEAAEAEVARLQAQVTRLGGRYGLPWWRRAYLAVRRLGGRVLRRLGLRPPLPTGSTDDGPEA